MAKKYTLRYTGGLVPDVYQSVFLPCIVTPLRSLNPNKDTDSPSLPLPLPLPLSLSHTHTHT